MMIYGIDFRYDFGMFHSIQLCRSYRAFITTNACTCYISRIFQVVISLYVLQGSSRNELNLIIICVCKQLNLLLWFRWCHPNLPKIRVSTAVCNQVKISIFLFPPNYVLLSDMRGFASCHCMKVHFNMILVFHI